MGGGTIPTLKKLFQEVNGVVVKSLFILASVVLLGLTSCQSLDDINDRLDKVEVEVSDLKSAVKALQDAYGQAKIIRSVLPLEDGTHGWLITFTDNTEIIFVDGIVADVTKDEATGVITIGLNDGRSFWFNTRYVSPTSIAILRTRPVGLSCGSQDTIEFRVNPSNASFKTTGDGCQIELDKVGEVKTRASYVTAPSYYKLVGVEQVCDESTNEVKIGQYQAIIEDTQVCAEYDEMAALVMNVEDANGDKIQISSSAFEVKGHNYDNLPMTGLPVVIINTPNAAPIVSKEEYVTESTITLLNADMTYDYQGEMKIKGRGNSTWTHAPKHPYKIKFDNKVSLYGYSADKEWVLLANYWDPICIRTSLAFYLGHKFTNLEYTPNIVTADLILNGTYSGTYQLCEQIKISKSRVNVGDDGFLMEVDGKASDGDVLIDVPHLTHPVNIKGLDLLEGDDNYQYIKSFLIETDRKLYSDDWLDPITGYKSMIDIESFVDWYLVNEISKNADANMYTSCYMNLKRGCKLKMGPLWDFDVAFGNYVHGNEDLNKIENFRIKTAPWFNRMFEDPEFVSLVKYKFNVYYSNIPSIFETIDGYDSFQKRSCLKNNQIWSTLCSSNSSDSEVEAAYAAKVSYLKNWLYGRLEWLKVAFEGL